jgi:hypothetical protein
MSLIRKAYAIYDKNMVGWLRRGDRLWGVGYNGDTFRRLGVKMKRLWQGLIVAGLCMGQGLPVLARYWEKQIMTFSFI